MNDREGSSWRVGSSKDHKRRAEAIAQKINAAIALGSFHQPKAEEPLRCDEELNGWHARWQVTMSYSYEINTAGPIKSHPYFGPTDLRALTEVVLPQISGH